MRKSLSILVMAGLATAAASADDWMTPEPVAFQSRGPQHVAEIFPPHSRQNPGAKPVCFFYDIGYPGPTWKTDAALKWKGQLVAMPYEALVSMDGWLVTLDEYGHVGYDHAVVVYDPLGKLVRSLSLAEIVPPGESTLASGMLAVSSSSRWWRDEAKFQFSNGKLYGTFGSGKTFEITLRDGAARYGVAPPAADSNGQTEVWKTSLRVASITDVLEARKR